MSGEFLGVSWNAPVGPARGQIAMAAYEENVRQAIRTILGTAPGERVMRPDFGCGIHDLVFAVNSPGAAGQAADAVRDALLRWESRVEVLNVRAIPSAQERNLLLIELDYRVHATNSRVNLVYPFYLE